MEFKEFTGKTVDDAITEALVSMGVTSDQIEYEVIEKGGSGFLGLKAKPAVIRARKKAEDAATKQEATEPAPKMEEPVAKEEPVKTEAEPLPEKEETAKKQAAVKKEESAKEPIDFEAAKTKIQDFLSQVFQAMKMDVEVVVTESEEKDMVNVDLKGDDMGVLIGKRGATLDALQYLTNLNLNKHSDRYIRVKMDTENYRERRKATLENLAKNLASKAKRTGRNVELEPMNPYERRVIHFALQDDPAVETYSTGQEPYRHVVIVLKK